MEYLIGVDLGTSTVKAAFFNVEGQVVAEASRAINIHYPGPGCAGRG